MRILYLINTSHDLVYKLGLLFLALDKSNSDKSKSNEFHYHFLKAKIKNYLQFYFIFTIPQYAFLESIKLSFFLTQKLIAYRYCLNSRWFSIDFLVIKFYLWLAQLDYIIRTDFKLKNGIIMNIRFFEYLQNKTLNISNEMVNFQKFLIAQKSWIITKKTQWIIKLFKYSKKIYLLTVCVSLKTFNGLEKRFYVSLFLIEIPYQTKNQKKFLKSAYHAFRELNASIR